MAVSIPLSNSDKVTLISECDVERVSQLKLHLQSDGYVVTSHKNYLHVIIYGRKSVDHKDRNKLNNTRENLRACGTLGQSANRSSQNTVGRTSKYKGVNFNKTTKKWRAELRSEGKNYFLGYHFEEADAALAYNKKAIEVFGEFAFINKID